MSATAIVPGLSRSDGAGRAAAVEQVRTLPVQELRDRSRSLGQRRRRTLSRAAPADEILFMIQGEKHPRSMHVEPGAGKSACAALCRRTDIRFAEPNRRLHRQFTPNDSLLTNQWHHSAIDTFSAWDLSLGTSALKIAIVDWPFQMNHPDLAGQSLPGWDVVNETPVFTSSVPGTYGYDDHSTISAGLAAATVNNGSGVAGIGNFKMFPVNNAYPDFTTDIALVYDAVIWAADNGARVVNVSWLGAESSTLNQAGDYLRQTTDGVLVMAGGNGSGYLDYTNHLYITAVSMTDSSDQLRSYSGGHIDFSAPGFNVYSTGTPGSYETGSGSSYAAPVFSGALAWVMTLDPALSAEQALGRLRETAVDLGETGWDATFGWGRLDIGNLVEAYLKPELEWVDASSIGASYFSDAFTYTLWSKTELNALNWDREAVSLSTNGSEIVGFTVSASMQTSVFYRVTGKMN